MTIDSPYLAEPGKKLRLHKLDPSQKGPFKHKDDAAAEIAANLLDLEKLQDKLYAGSEKALLIVIQAIDTGGKDGAIKHVFSGINPEGCQVSSFKQPSKLELAHDFLWRIHAAMPPRGTIGIFNRSHYESVIVERVHNLVPKKVWSKRYDTINQFEQMLTDEGTVIVKFFLNISKAEQKERLKGRLDDPDKNWKFDPADLAERERWDDYQEAFQDAIEKCSTEAAPWYVVPADHKWFRDWVIGNVLVETLRKMKLKYPAPPDGLDQVHVK
jgi:PPK2 family polyphosphate:nucleotide phosphotransferase